MTFSTAASVANNRLISARGEAITYRRGSVESDGLVAIPGIDEMTREAGDGFTAEVKTRDFLIKASSLDVGSLGVIEPEPGDEIDWNNKTYEVASPGGSVPAWAYEGHRDFFVRVHTRET